QEQRELKDRAAALQAELDKSQAATVNAEKFMGIVRKHLAFEELTHTLLREMIEKIVVHECSYDENGTRRQDIEICYSFVRKIDNIVGSECSYDENGTRRLDIEIDFSLGCKIDLPEA